MEALCSPVVLLEVDFLGTTAFLEIIDLTGIIVSREIEDFAEIMAGFADGSLIAGA